MVTYPLNFPNIGINSSRFAKGNVVQVSESPFTKEQQLYRNAGEWWEGEATFRPMTKNESNEVKAFLLKLRGRMGTFLYGDPDYLALGSQGVGGGTPLVNGASQTGNTLNVDGFPVSTLVYKAGDYFQLGSALTSRLYQLTDDVTSDGLGEATLNFEPAIITAPADNDAITFAGAKGLFRLVEDLTGWESNASSVTSITVAFRSVI